MNKQTNTRKDDANNCYFRKKMKNIYRKIIFRLFYIEMYLKFFSEEKKEVNLLYSYL